ncbi:General substrate transporter [Artemisia annua]|uniref:General substrate transporter n=1 Tax=Artemisia annua TaxID=35608 RepID=A0A2U1MPX4_ARTAN|nr:General substrate transporter [Artemisia annua]
MGMAALSWSGRCPALLMTVGGILLPKTPNSLIEQGSKEKRRKVLERIRSTQNVDAKFAYIVDASELANSIKHPFRNILKRNNRCQLVMAIFMPTFQILTGINSILFYAPVLFQSLGFKGNASLYSYALTGPVLCLSNFVSIATVDKLARRVLMIGGIIQMILCQSFLSLISHMQSLVSSGGSGIFSHTLNCFQEIHRDLIQFEEELTPVALCISLVAAATSLNFI